MTHWTRASLPTRRQFLALAGLAGASTAIGASPFDRRLVAAAVFEEIPPIDRYITIVEGKGRIG